MTFSDYWSFHDSVDKLFLHMRIRTVGKKLHRPACCLLVCIVTAEMSRDMWIIFHQVRKYDRRLVKNIQTILTTREESDSY